MISYDSIKLVQANFKNGFLEITTDRVMPYDINFSPDLSRNTILKEDGNMVIVAIDNKLAGSVARDYDLGYIIETRSKDRRNPILDTTLSNLPRSQLGPRSTFGFVPAERSDVILIKQDNV